MTARRPSADGFDAEAAWRVVADHDVRSSPQEPSPGGDNAPVSGTTALSSLEKSYEPERVPDFRNMARFLVREAARPWPGENAKAALARASDMLGLGLRRAYALFYGEARRVGRAEAAALRARTLDVLRQRLRQTEAETARLRSVIAALEGEPCDVPVPSDSSSVISWECWLPVLPPSPASATASDSGSRIKQSG